MKKIILFIIVLFNIFCPSIYSQDFNYKDPKYYRTPKYMLREKMFGFDVESNFSNVPFVGGCYYAYKIQHFQLQIGIDAAIWSVPNKEPWLFGDRKDMITYFNIPMQMALSFNHLNIFAGYSYNPIWENNMNENYKKYSSLIFGIEIKTRHDDDMFIGCGIGLKYSLGLESNTIYSDNKPNLLSLYVSLDMGGKKKKYLSAKSYPDTFKKNGIKYYIDDKKYSQFVYVIKDNYQGNIIIPEEIMYKGRTVKVTHIVPEAFANCNDLTGIWIPQTITHIGSKAFANCKNLKTINYEAIDIQTNYAESIFKNCNSIENVFIGNNVKTIPAYFMNCNSKISNIHLPDSVKTINKFAFANNHYLTSIDIPLGLEFIGEGCFSNCDNLKTISLPPNLSYAGNRIFDNCNSLEEVFYSVANQLAKDINISFDNCSNLTTVNIDDCVKHLPKNFLKNCTNLKTLVLPDNLISIDDSAFYGCNSLESINIPAPMKRIGNNVFGNCNDLHTIYYNAKELNKSSDVIFPGNNIEKVIIGDIVEKIPDNFLTNCYTIKEIIIPNNVKIIGRSAFENCRNLAYIKLPDTLDYIMDKAFENCKNLRNIEMKTLLKAEKQPFYNVPSLTVAEEQVRNSSSIDYASLGADSVFVQTKDSLMLLADYEEEQKSKELQLKYEQALIDAQNIVDDLKKREPIRIICYDFYQNSVCGIDVTFKVLNTSPQTIKYISFTGVFKNPVGDLCRNEINGKTSFTVRGIGPIGGRPTTQEEVPYKIDNMEAEYNFEHIFYSCVANNYNLTSVTITYMNGKTLTLSGKKLKECLLYK